MKAMIASAAVLVLGAVIVGIQPFLSDAASVDAATPGIYPHWITPVGYFMALIGALALVASWIAWRRRR